MPLLDPTRISDRAHPVDHSAVGPETYAKGRVCLDCDTHLSIYNAFDLCWQCDVKRERRFLTAMADTDIEELIEGGQLTDRLVYAGLALEHGDVWHLD